MKNNKEIAVIAIGAALLLAGCDRSQQQAGTQASPPQATPAPADPMAPRYSATLAEGISFAKPGYPEFVSGVSGISFPEPFGRWTDSTRATITFAKPLPRKFDLKIVGSQRTDKPVAVTVGSTRSEVSFPRIWDMKEVTIPVTTDGNANAIVIDIPDVRSPAELGQGVDIRRTGVALFSLKIGE